MSRDTANVKRSSAIGSVTMPATTTRVVALARGAPMPIDAIRCRHRGLLSLRRSLSCSRSQSGACSERAIVVCPPRRASPPDTRPDAPDDRRPQTRVDGLGGDERQGIEHVTMGQAVSLQVTSSSYSTVAPNGRP